MLLTHLPIRTLPHPVHNVQYLNPNYTARTCCITTHLSKVNCQRKNSNRLQLQQNNQYNSELKFGTSPVWHSKSGQQKRQTYLNRNHNSTDLSFQTSKQFERREIKFKPKIHVLFLQVVFKRKHLTWKNCKCMFECTKTHTLLALAMNYNIIQYYKKTLTFETQLKLKLSDNTQHDGTRSHS